MKVTHYFPIVVNKINMSLLLPVFLICIFIPYIYLSGSRLAVVIKRGAQD